MIKTTEKNLLKKLLQVSYDYGNDEQLNETAKLMFKMYSQMGFPPDMFLDRLDLNNEAKLYIVVRYQDCEMEHKTISGITARRKESQQKRNRATLVKFIETGEVGIY